MRGRDLLDPRFRVITDLHSHILPDVDDDDGRARFFAEVEELLRSKLGASGARRDER